MIKSKIKVNVKLMQKLMKNLQFHSMVTKKFQPTHIANDKIVHLYLVKNKHLKSYQILSTDITYIDQKTGVVSSFYDCRLVY